MMSVGDDDNDNDFIKKHLLYLLYNHVFRQEFKKKINKNLHHQNYINVFLVG